MRSTPRNDNTANDNRAQDLPPSVSADGPDGRPGRRGQWIRRLLGGLGCAAILAAALTLPGAWRETQHREAYLPQLQAQAARAPYDGRLLALLGGRLAEAHEYPAAAGTLERALAVNEKTPDVWLTLAACTAATGDRSALPIVRLGLHDTDAPALRAALARAQALGPHPATAALAHALCPQGTQPLLDRYAGGSLFNRWSAWWGRRHPAESGFETRRQWAEGAPNDAQAQQLWGEALLRNRRGPEAVPVLERAVALAPDSPAAHLALADARNELGVPSEAALEYIAALKHRPGWAPALEGLGRDALALDLSQAAADVFARAVQADPKNADAWIGLGQADVRAQQNYDQALTAFETAARLAPSRTEYFDDYALALKESNRAGEAEALLRRRLAAMPADAYGHYLLASLLRDNQATPLRAAEAMIEVREALRREPASHEARLLRGQLLLDAGKTAEGMATLNAELADDPSDLKAMQTLVPAYRRVGQPAQAQRLAARAKSLFDDSQAIDVLKAQVQRAPSDLPVHQRLAALYARTGQPDKAREEQGVVSLLRAHPELQGAATQTLPALIRAALAAH